MIVFWKELLNESFIALSDAIVGYKAEDLFRVFHASYGISLSMQTPFVGGLIVALVASFFTSAKEFAILYATPAVMLALAVTSSFPNLLKRPNLAALANVLLLWVPVPWILVCRALISIFLDGDSPYVFLYELILVPFAIPIVGNPALRYLTANESKEAKHFTVCIALTTMAFGVGAFVRYFHIAKEEESQEKESRK
jgi:hypothetical protein